LDTIIVLAYLYLLKVKVKRVKVPIVSIALSQLCDLRVGAHLRLYGPETNDRIVPIGLADHTV